jgi:glutamine synthetase
MSEDQLLALAVCDLGAIVRGRSIVASELESHLHAGVSWVPANHTLTPLGALAQDSPFGSVGDLRLLPDRDTHARVEGDSRVGPFELMLCDIVHTDGSPWECCPRRFLRETLAELHRTLGALVLVSFEHEFQLLLDAAPALAFSLDGMRRAEPFAARVMGALREAGTAPQRFLSEYAAHQFEIPVAPAEGMAGADRAVILREVIRELATREGMRASFTPLLDRGEAGNGVHIHLSLIDEDGRPLLYDADREASLSELGGSFAAGILRHARALSALTAPSPLSAARLEPHRWSAGAACLAKQNREALLRIPPLVTLQTEDPARQMRLEYRGADAAANPYLALGAILRAGLEGVRAQLPAPAILDVDPATLDAKQAERFGVGALPASLEQALAALAEDQIAHDWLDPLLYEAYVAVKHSELQAVAELDPEEVCRRYAAIY